MARRRARRPWPGARGRSVAMLKGDASTRRFWRVALEAPPDDGASSATLPASAIAINLGPDDLPAYVRALNLISTVPESRP